MFFGLFPPEWLPSMAFATDPALACMWLRDARNKAGPIAWIGRGL